MSFIPKPHEIYKHFKGNLYQVTAIAEHTETGEQLVVYQALYGDFQTYARPLSLFVGRVDKGKYPDVAQEFRFELQGPEAGRQKAESEDKAIEQQRAKTKDSTTIQQKTESKDGAAVQQTVESKDDTAEQQRAKSKDGTMVQQIAETKDSAENSCEEGELSLDPQVLEFLDADSYGQKLNILACLHHRITDEMITIMAIASDIEINEGDTEERYEALRTCLLTLERYECNRLR